MMRNQPLAAIDRRSRHPGELYQPLYEGHLQSLDVIRNRATLRRWRGVFRSGRPEPGRLQQVHSVLSVSGFAVHGVGEHLQFPHQGFGGIEPLGRGPLKHNLATICERYGGGGHPRVGAISFEIGAIEQARRVAEKSGTNWRRTNIMHDLFADSSRAAHDAVFSGASPAAPASG